MKKLKLLLPLFLAGLFLVSCGEKPNDNGHDDDHSDDGQGMEMVDPPKFIIPVHEADNLYLNYGNNRADFLEEVVNEQNPDLEEEYTPTRFVTVDFDEMYQYMKFVKQQSDKAKIKPEGLRFYFGQIKSKGSKGIDPGVETLFFNPTANFDGIEGGISYAIKTDVSGNISAVTVGSIIDSSKTQQTQKGANLLLQGGIQSLAGNRGHLPPPPHPGDPDDYH
ncbi:hypothetical protein EAX61_14175 [Dokdonia sinensis]|uniref:Lipoprotein n=1 Tax=Dokdonia sinensis TaxID=2479847 RepID=A0A3M0G2X5_9FLAO|nr:hypothetical protein [Dokdonia sinensis]RMB56552.1 hypothetical protein EAX61_14175 [Dokdonia sinensis]